MDERAIRLIVVLGLFALSVFRMWKKARGGKPSTPPAVQMPTRAAPAPPSAPIDPTPAPVGPLPDPWLDSGGSSPLAMFAAGVVWIGGNVAMWLALFELPALADIPVNWRLAAGVIGNLFLIWLARAVAARLRRRRSPQMPGGNPFPDS